MTESAGAKAQVGSAIGMPVNLRGLPRGVVRVRIVARIPPIDDSARSTHTSAAPRIDGTR